MILSTVAPGAQGNIFSALFFHFSASAGKRFWFFRFLITLVMAEVGKHTMLLGGKEGNTL